MKKILQSIVTTIKKETHLHLAIGVLIVVTSSIWGLRYIAKYQYQQSTLIARESGWPIDLRFPMAEPQIRKPFISVLDGGFRHGKGQNYFHSSPALSYLDKNDNSTQKLADRYESLWELFEHLQFLQDYKFEKKALRIFRTASERDVLSEMGHRDAPGTLGEEERTYFFLTNYGLEWYLETYYLKPASQIASSRMYGRCRNLTKEAADRVRFRVTGVGEYLDPTAINKALLMEALFSRPMALIGHESFVDLSLRIIREYFPADGRYALEAEQVSQELVPIKKYLLAVYSFRDRSFEGAEDKFIEVSKAQGVAQELQDLALFMSIRSRFWNVHASLKKHNKVLRPAEARSLSNRFISTSQAIHSNNLAANAKEYAALVQTDFTSYEKLYPPKIKGGSRSGKEDSQLQTNQDLALPVPLPLVPSIQQLNANKEYLDSKNDSQSYWSLLKKKLWGLLGREDE